MFPDTPPQNPIDPGVVAKFSALKNSKTMVLDGDHGQLLQQLFDEVSLMPVDLLWGDSGGDFLKGGPGADRFFGGYGNDLIDSRDGVTEHVYCGEGTDRAEADLRDILHNCEKVVRRPANEIAQARAPR